MEDMQWVTMNPAFELHPAEFVLDVRNICKNDNMKAINAAVSVDLTGQIAAESVGPRILSGAGGQTTFAMGAGLSRGGRSITVLPVHRFGRHYLPYRTLAGSRHHRDSAPHCRRYYHHRVRHRQAKRFDPETESPGADRHRPS